MKKIHIIDSHTGGEPTRLIVAGGPDLGSGPLADRLKRFQQDFDGIRKAVVCEPRGSDVIVGALLCEPHEADCVTGVIFFNNVSYLGMCGHGTIGFIKSLEYMGKISHGTHRIDTPVGVVEAQLHEDGKVTVHNVPSYRYREAVTVDVPNIGKVTGDIAWGGNWFFLVSEHGQTMDVSNVEQLTNFSWAVRQALTAQGITGEDGAEIDHVELFGAAVSSENHSRNFVLCPGKAYDRSPCGTGTSAKLACLASAGKLAANQIWRQESIIGSVFEARYQKHPSDARMILPSLTGTAFVNSEAQFILDENDPFCYGI
jgi:4-hydroxyproline epimerase